MPKIKLEIPYLDDLQGLIVANRNLCDQLEANIGRMFAIKLEVEAKINQSPGETDD